MAKPNRRNQAGEPVVSETNETQETVTLPEETVTEAVEAPVVTEAPVVPVEPVVVPVVPVVPVAPPVVKEAKVVEPTPAPAVAAPVSNFEQLINEVKQKGTPAEISLIGKFEYYMEKMQPGRVVELREGAGYQYGLWKAIDVVMTNAPVDNFNKLWNIILAYFNEYQKTVLRPARVFSCSEEWAYDEDALKAFQNILNIIYITCDPSTRKNWRNQVDLNRSLAVGVSEEGRNRVLSFYA